MRLAITFLALASLAACGTSHGVADAGMDASPDSTTLDGGPDTDSGVDTDGSVDTDGAVDEDGGAVGYDFTWESAGEPPSGTYGTRDLVALDRDRALWLGGSDWFGSGTSAVRIFQSDADSWRDLGNTTTLTGISTFMNGNHSATVLTSGDVLYAGSGNQDRERHAYDTGRYGSVCVVFHPSDESLTVATPLPARRAFHGAALLPDGRVLAIGGVTTPDTPISGERFELTVEPSTLYYDPVADAWSDGPPLSEARYQPGVTVLPGGDVLVVGGFDASNTPLRSVERYHASTGTWSSVASTTDPRVWHVQALLPSGQVLVAGGADALGDAIDTAEVYDPGADTWSPVAPLPLPAALAAGLTLDNGDVLVTGGYQIGATKVAIPQVVAYREASDTWLSLPRLITGRFYHGAVQLEDGRLLVAGGYRYDNATMHFTRDSEITSVALR